MPILNIEMVTDEALLDGMAARIADAAAPVFGAAPGTVWVKLHRLASACYAENGPKPPPPVFISVIRRTLPAGDAAGEEHARLASAIAGAIGVSVERVHITYEPAASGRQSFGGTLVK